MPSFWIGWGRQIDLFGCLSTDNNHALFDEAADARAIASDWRTVGGDIWHALERYEHASPARRPATDQDRART